MWTFHASPWRFRASFITDLFPLFLQTVLVLTLACNLDSDATSRGNLTLSAHGEMISFACVFCSHFTCVIVCAQLSPRLVRLLKSGTKLSTEPEEMVLGAGTKGARNSRILRHDVVMQNACTDAIFAQVKSIYRAALIHR